MNGDTEAWRIKIPSRKTTPTPTLCCKTKHYKKDVKSENSVKTDHTVLSLSKILGKNCCNCCCLILELFKQVFKMVQGDTNARICDFLCNLSEILVAIANDSVLLLKRICKCLISGVK